MSRLTTFELTPELFFEQTTQIFSPFHLEPLDSSLDLLITPPFFDLLELATPTHLLTRRLKQPQLTPTEFYLQSLSDRVSALESTLLSPKPKPKLDRKYTWTAEISSPEKDGLDRKYKLTTEIKAGKKKEEKAYKWTAQIKGKGENSKVNRKYTFEASVDNAGDELKKKEKKKEKNDVVYKKTKKVVPARVVEIEEEEEAAQGAIVLRQAFAKRAAAKSKGKKKELSYQDAAIMIQVSFRAYLIRRSQALRALRELAVAKAKLKELRALFNNFTYRRRLTLNAEERQKFSERIIVLLLTVDAIEGADVMVRAAKRSMVDELEAMLDVVDPQPQGRSLSLRRRTFDMPDGVIQKEIAAGVAQVVQMLNEEEDGA
ncbi:BCL-2-associated athanogene 7 [Heracleum sosnowskyi]|uniref:BCL-2-associated athanogene 7 n=1 Tax=Heracleum sosnowskyi TaxID=360622 RepID=A0AAD8HI76_9APIA|nr:BCL-2-associated athanogene 7 [Heracleum sosnowskyi]